MAEQPKEKEPDEKSGSTQHVETKPVAIAVPPATIGARGN